MDRSEEKKMSIAARASRDAHVECAPILGAPLEWQSIDTAPKDGTKIDLLYPHPRGRTINCYWDKALSAWVWRTPRWYNGELAPESRWDFNSYPNDRPSHWMYPPTLPAEDSTPDDTGSERSEHRDVQTNTSLPSEEKEAQ